MIDYLTYLDLQLLLITVLSIQSYLLTWYPFAGPISRPKLKKTKAKQKRGPKPRSAQDCFQCRLGIHQRPLHKEREVEPWRNRKGKAGRKKRACSHSCACPNPKCYYYGITDSRFHALVSNGWRRGAEPIRQWKCQACQKKFSERYGTPLYRLKKTSFQVAQVMTAMAVGVSISDGVTIFEYHHTTITRWLARAGKHGAAFHNHYFREFEAEHIQLDELKTKVKKNKKVVWLWTAVDATTKVLLGLYLGDRAQFAANRLLHEVKERLSPESKPIYTSDGFMMYFYALTSHYGKWFWRDGGRKFHWQVDKDLLYGQFRKIRSGFRLKNIYTLMQWGERQAMTLALQAMALSGQIQTAFVERLNLTLRQLVAPLRRKTWSLANDKVHLLNHVEWVRCFYHFARPHMSLKVALANGRTGLQTPAMAASVIDRKLAVRDILLTPMYPSLC